MVTEMTTVRQMIEFLADQIKHSSYRFFLEHGEDWGERLQTPVAYFARYSVPQACYRNACLLALTEPDDLTYVEGLAASDRLGFPIEHAWCVTPNGSVIDPTWEPGGGEYFGVPFAHDYIYDLIVNKSVEVPPIIDDWRNEWPLLNGKHGGPEEWRAVIRRQA